MKAHGIVFFSLKMLGAGKVCISCVEYQCCPWGFSEICSFAFCFRSILGAQGNCGTLAKIELPQMKAFFTLTFGNSSPQSLSFLLMFMVHNIKINCLKFT